MNQSINQSMSESKLTSAGIGRILFLQNANAEVFAITNDDVVLAVNHDLRKKEIQHQHSTAAGAN